MLPGTHKHTKDFRLWCPSVGVSPPLFQKLSKYAISATACFAAAVPQCCRVCGLTPLGASCSTRVYAHNAPENPSKSVFRAPQRRPCHTVRLRVLLVAAFVAFCASFPCVWCETSDGQSAEFHCLPHTTPAVVGAAAVVLCVRLCWLRCVFFAACCFPSVLLRGESVSVSVFVSV